LPELGRMSRKQVAALVGVAPYAFESGTLKGLRLPRRAPPRSRHTSAPAGCSSLLITSTRRDRFGTSGISRHPAAANGSPSAERALASC
jgi:hypothetical protein